jgi:glycosyltransferase involved in cell wall biosynthesis
MAMSIPVLHGVAGESARIVESEEVGFTFAPKDSAALAGHTLRLARDDGLRRTLGARGVEAARRYDRRALAASMLDTLEALACARASTTLPWRGLPGGGGPPERREAGRRRA